MRSSKEDFTFNKRLGTGTYGTVWQAVRKQDGKTYAVKELDLRYLQKQVNFCRQELCHRFSIVFQSRLSSLQDQAECIREVKVLSDLDSPYIIKFFDSFLDQVYCLSSCMCRSAYVMHKEADASNDRRANFTLSLNLQAREVSTSS